MKKYLQFLVAFLFLVAFASVIAFAHHSMKIPDAQIFEMKSMLQEFESVTTGMSDEKFVDSLLKMDESNLFLLIGEASQLAESKYGSSSMLVFNEVMASKIAPNITPEMLSEILYNSEYPLTFITYVCDFVWYVNSVPNDEGLNILNDKYASVLREFVSNEDNWKRDELVFFVMNRIP